MNENLRKLIEELAEFHSGQSDKRTEQIKLLLNNKITNEEFDKFSKQLEKEWLDFYDKHLEKVDKCLISPADRKSTLMKCELESYLRNNRTVMADDGLTNAAKVKIDLKDAENLETLQDIYRDSAKKFFEFMEERINEMKPNAVEKEIIRRCTYHFIEASADKSIYNPDNNASLPTLKGKIQIS